MSQQFPSAQGPDQPVADLSEFDTTTTTTRRLSRNSIIAAAACAVLLGGGAAGFLFVNSAPGGDSAEAAVPVTTSGALPTGSATSSATSGSSAFAFSGRDVFDNTVAPVVVDSTGSGSSDATTSASTTGGSSTGGGLVPTATSTKTSTPSPSSTTPKATATVSPSTSTTPTPTKSSLPGWTVPSVTFEGVNGTAGVFDVGGGLVTVLPGQEIYPLNVVFDGLDGSMQALLHEVDHPATTWAVPLNADAPVALPAGVVGNPTSRLRVYGVLDSKSYWMRIDNQPGATYKVDDAVAGTPFTFKGFRTDQSPVFEDVNGITYVGSFGAGEADGVAF